MEPYLYGASTGMSTVAVLVSAVFWTWLWGPVGLLMATPLTVVLVVIGKYVPQMRFLDILLGDEPVLEPPERVYQRLLAMDQEEATELLHDYLKEMDLEQLYDEVLNPALALAEQDRHRGRLDERRQAYVHQAMRQMVDEMGDAWRERQDRSDADAIKSAAADTVEAAKGGAAKVSESPAPDRVARAAPKGPAANGGNGKAAPPAAAADVAPALPPVVRVPVGCTVNVVILPAHDEADEISSLMLAQLLEFRGYCPLPVSVTKLASEMVETIGEKAAHVVAVSAMPPAAATHARYLCKRVHARFPEAKMVVGLWTAKGDLARAKDRVACEGSVYVTSTFRDALQETGQLAQPVIVAADTAAAQSTAPQTARGS